MSSHRRLKDVGLTSLALELHSSKANKRALLEELKRTRDAAAPAPRIDGTLVQRLTDCRDRLNSHAEMMHAPHEPSGLTPFRLLGSLIRSRENSRASEYSLDAPETWSPLDFENKRELIEEVAERIASDGPPHQHPWRGVDRDALDPGEMQSLRNALEALGADLANLVVCAEHASALFGSGHRARSVKQPGYWHSRRPRPTCRPATVRPSAIPYGNTPKTSPKSLSEASVSPAPPCV